MRQELPALAASASHAHDVGGRDLTADPAVRTCTPLEDGGGRRGETGDRARAGGRIDRSFDESRVLEAIGAITRDGRGDGSPG